ncbi:MAG: hypothetical protein JWO12_2961 [Frankiales bacterium]|nr:hypothetical protein [Frankiales bacterium]
MNRSAVAGTVAVGLIAGAFLLSGGRGASPARAVDEPAADSGVVVDGTGKVTGTPDVLRATLGVSLRRDNVGTALQDANSLQEKVRKALKGDGVAAEDLQTSDVSISPSYDNRGKRNGYSVSETLTVKLRNLKKAGQAITDAVSAGGDAAVLNGVSFALEDNAALLQKARDAAYAEAKAKAERYAELSGRGLGKVLLVAETTSPPVQPVSDGFASGAAAFDKAASPVPIDAGTSQVSVSVTVRWALQ